MVLFSGGRDSSAVLAMAVDVARRHTLPDPVALTFRFPSVVETQEDPWQESVVRHLGLDDWTTRIVGDELDLLGPYARRVVGRHGLFWPANAYFVSFAASLVGHGSLVAGAFGDELLTPDPLLRVPDTGRGSRWGRAARHLARGAIARSPQRVRRRFVARRHLRQDQIPSWMSATGRALARDAMIADLAHMYARWDHGIRGTWRSRYTQMVSRSLDEVVQGEGMRLVMPFGDPRFRVAFARFGGRRGFVSRTEAMRSLFGDLLPPETVRRGTKALFGGVFWNRETHAFTRRWSGVVPDPELVDVEVLRREWSWDLEGERRPDFRSATLLHAVWLAEEGPGVSDVRDGVQQPARGV